MSNKEKKENLKTLKGMKDIMPEEHIWWEWVEREIEDIISSNNFVKVTPPALERAFLFTKSVGDSTDIVSREMYVFKDKSGETVALRPEFTAQIARMYIEHGLHTRPQPVRLYCFGPLWRHDNPQAARLRQFHQFDLEVLGEAHPVIDAQVINTVVNIYRDFGLPIRVPINSIGDQLCRPDYLKTLVSYLKSKQSKLCPDCQRRAKENPLRVLDCKEERCQSEIIEAPQLVDWLCEECKNHFTAVLEYLDELDIPYELDTRLVRGLDYYTRTTFEVWLNRENLKKDEIDNNLSKEGSIASVASQAIFNSALGGGGRYDRLVEQLGGRETPAIGFAGGIERLILALKSFEKQPPVREEIGIFIAQLGQEARKRSLKLSDKLRSASFKVLEAFFKDSLSAQLETAAKSKARFTLILGQKELIDRTVIIRDMESGIQEIVDIDKVDLELKKRIDKLDSDKDNKFSKNGQE